MSLKFFACRATTLSTPTLPENELHNIAILANNITVAYIRCRPEIPVQEGEPSSQPLRHRAIDEIYPIGDET